MTGNPVELLIYGLRDAGLWSPDQARAAIDRILPITDIGQMVERFKESGPLTSYQIRKLRHGRAVDLTLGTFVILEKIGEGGMGKVYKAMSSKLGKAVALKVVRSHLMTNKTVLRRYKREAAAAAALSHPNIVTLLDADEIEGRYYLAMEYVEGSDLSRLVKENGPLPPQEAAEYIRQSALGLQHAHERGLIHRDIKPSNLLVSGERAIPGTDGQANLKILDMGLVRSILDDDDGGVSRTELTRDGTVVGTPDYMAPEQAKNSSKVDARADLYSLGATLYYMLRGQPPFPEGSPIDKLLRHQLDPPPDLRKARSDIPAGLIAIVNKLLKKNPDERYASASELAVAIQPFTPAADAGLIFAPEAEGVTLDLPVSNATVASRGGPAPSNVPQIIEAEIVEASIVSTPKTKSSVRPKAPVKKSAAKPIVRSTQPMSSDPNSGSMPGSDGPTKMPGSTPTRVATSRSGDRSTPPRVPYRKPGTDQTRKVVGIVAIGAAAILLLIAAIVFLSSGNKSTKTSNDTKAKDTTTAPTPTVTPENNPPATPVVLSRTDMVLADNTSAALMIYPQQHWKRSVYETGSHPNTTGWLKWLIGKNGFDTSKLDRVTVSFLDDRFSLAVGEGAGLNDAWQKKMASQFDMEEYEKGWKSQVKIYNAKGLAYRPLGIIFGNEVIAIGHSDQPLFGQNPLRNFGSRFVNNKPARNVDAVILKSMPAPNDSDPPFATFVATKNWRLPDRDRNKLLFDYGVTSLIVKARIDGEEFDIEMTVTGDSETRLKNEFISLGLATHLTVKNQGLTPFLEPLASATPQVSTAEGKTVLKVRWKFPIADAQNWIDTLIGTAPVN